LKLKGFLEGRNAHDMGGISDGNKSCDVQQDAVVKYFATYL
jgi:hypothetical protein